MWSVTLKYGIRPLQCKAVPFQLIRESFGILFCLLVAATESSPLCSAEPRGRVQAGGAMQFCQLCLPVAPLLSRDRANTWSSLVHQQLRWGPCSQCLQKVGLGMEGQPVFQEKTLMDHFYLFFNLLREEKAVIEETE